MLGEHDSYFQVEDIRTISYNERIFFVEHMIFVVVVVHLFS